MSTPISSEDTKITFGKHKGKTITEVLKEAPSYLLWAHMNVDFFKLDNRLLKIVKILGKEKSTFPSNPKYKLNNSDAIENLHDEDDGNRYYDVPF